MAKRPTVHIFEEMKRWLTLIAVRVNGWGRRWAMPCMDRATPGGYAGAVSLEVAPASRLTPIRVNARPELHLFSNMQSQRFHMRKVRT